MFDIISEEKILFASEAFKNLGNVTLCKGNRLTAKDLKCIDILLIRSGTRVDQDLLEGTPVQFVASATVGTDHVNKAYLARKGIPFYHAPGCNAESVVEYVIASLLNVAHRKQVTLAQKTVGIIGAGNIGGRLAKRLPVLGINVIVNDPPLEASGVEQPIEFVSLDVLMERADIVTVHTPLDKIGDHKTYHLIDEKRLRLMKPDAWLINAARGAIVSNRDLKKVLQDGHLGAVVLDVWENEPLVDIELMEFVDIATPHIAGHSYEGKVNGTIQIYEAFTRHYDMDGGWDPQSILKPTSEDQLTLSMPAAQANKQRILDDLVRQMYDVEADDQLFRQSLDMYEEERKAFFLGLRKEYPRRRTFALHALNVGLAMSQQFKQQLQDGLGITIYD